MKRKNKLGLGFVICLLLVGLWTSMAFAAKVTAYNATGTVVNVKSSLTVREEPSTSGAVLGSVKNGEKVTITGKTDGWYRIKYGSETGYVSATYITAKENTSGKDNSSNKDSSSGSSSSSGITAVSKTGTISTSGSNLNVRKKASSSSEKIGSLKNGARVRITGQNADWYRIDFNGGKGFVSRSYVKAKKLTNSSVVEYTAKGYVTASSLNVRKKASSDSEKLGSLKKNASVSITGELKDWYRIKYNSKAAYVSRDYIAIGKAPADQKTEEKETETKPSSTPKYGKVTASSLNVRKEASTSSDVIGNLKKGEEVTIKGEKNDFYKIPYNSGYGYISKNYVEGIKKLSNNEDTGSSDPGSSDPGSSGSGDSGSTYKKITLNNVPLYKQDDSRWANVAIGDSTIKKKGCAVTCLAMCYEAYTDAVCTPAMMAKQLKFTSSGSVYWPDETTVDTKEDNYLKKIYKQLAAGKAVIVGGKNSSGSTHFVVVYGYNGDKSSLSLSGFMVNDPGFNDYQNMKSFFDKGFSFYKLVYYK